MSDSDNTKGIPDLQLHKASKQQEELVNLRSNLEQIKDMYDIIVEYQQVTARLRYSKYQSLKAAGFSEPEALTLCLQDKSVL